MKFFLTMVEITRKKFGNLLCNAKINKQINKKTKKIIQKPQITSKIRK
jgi:hypothetical protein